MDFFILSLITVLLLPLALWSTKNTPFELSLKTRNYSGSFIFIEIFLYVLPAVLIVEGIGIQHFSHFKNNSGLNVSFTSYFTLYSIALFFITIKFASYFVKVKANTSKLDPVDHCRVSLFTWSILISGLAIAFSLQLFFDVQHSFLEVLLGDADSIRSVRMHNRYIAKVPTVLFSLIKFCYLFSAVLACTKYFDSKKIQRILVIVGGMYLAAQQGSKGPVVYYLLLIYVSYALFHEYHFSLKHLFISVLFLFLSFLALLLAMAMQFGDLSTPEVLEYLFVRVGVGQMIGTYEQFDIELYNPQYILQSLPFSASFKNWPNYNKDIMLISQNVGDSSSTGVANSLFIAEAHAIGGITLAILSPIIVGISYLVSLKIFHIVAVKAFLKTPDSVRVCTLVFTSYAALTGGFTGWPALKIAIMLVVFTTVIIFPIKVFLFIMPKNMFRLPTSC